MFFIYAISSEIRNYIYVGLTNNFERSLKEHNTGLNKTTKPYRPFRVILTEKYEIRTDTRSREKYLNSGIGIEYLKNLIM